MVCGRVIACEHVPSHDKHFLEKEIAFFVASCRVRNHLEGLLLCKSLENMHGAQHRHDG